MKSLFLSSLDSFPYFTIEAVKQLLGDETAADGTVQTALYRWMKSGQIIQLKKGVYMTRQFHELHRPDADFAPMISAILIPQSFVSLEYTLQRNVVLTEMTYPVSAVTRKQTRAFHNKLGTFTYRNIKADLYTGFVIADYLGIPIAQSTVARRGIYSDGSAERPGSGSRAQRAISPIGNWLTSGCGLRTGGSKC